MKKRIVLFSVLILSITQLFGQNFSEQFNQYYADKDSVALKELLEVWEQTDANDPVLHVAYLNYYVDRSRKEYVVLDNASNNGEPIWQIMDKDTTQKASVGYMYSKIIFEPELLNKGFYYIDRGIELHPNRLDLRFSKIHMLWEIENYDKYTEEIIKAVNYSAINDNKWTWTDSEVVENAKDFFLNTIQDYQLRIYDTGNVEMLIYMEQIADAVLVLYPDHVESLSNRSICHMSLGEFEDALDVLLRAEKINPKDYIILANIAHVYMILEDIPNALKYYTLMAKYGDDSAKEFAKDRIDKLSKSQ